MSRNAFGAIEREQLRNDALRDQAKTEREAATCKHRYITTYVTEDGEPGGLWGCSVCNARFAPIADQIKAEQQRDALLAALEPFADIQHYRLAPDGAGFAMRSNGEAVTYGQIRAAKAATEKVKQP